MVQAPRYFYFIWISAVVFAFFGATNAFRSDELWSIYTSLEPYSRMMDIVRGDTHPPLFQWTLAVWTRVFGTSEISDRVLPGITYLFSCIAMYRLARRIYERDLAMLATAVYIASPLALFAAHFGRMYALLGLWSVLSTLFYVSFSFKPNESKVDFWLYIIVNALGTFTHIWFFFILFGQLVCQAFFYRQVRTKAFLLAYSLSLIPYMLLWAPYLPGQIMRSKTANAWIPKPGPADLVTVLFMFGGAAWLLAPAVPFVWRKVGRPKEQWPIRAFAVVLVVAIGTPFLISQVKPIFFSRFTMIGLPLFALLTAAYLSSLNRRQVAVALVSISGIGLAFGQWTATPCESRTAAAYLREHASGGDLVLFSTLSRLPTEYYLRQYPQRPPFMASTFPAEIDTHPAYPGRLIEQADALRAEAKQWLATARGLQKKNGEARVFFFHGFDLPVDAIMQKELDEAFTLQPAEGMHCGSVTDSYFNDIRVYRVK